MKLKTYTTKELAKLEGVTERTIRQRIEHNWYPNAEKRAIKFEWVIPESDLKKSTRK